MMKYLNCILVALIIGALCFFVGLRTGTKEHQVFLAQVKQRLDKIESRLPDNNDRVIHKIDGQEAQIDMDLLIQIESSGNPKALSKKGARGLAQIMQPTWDECTKLMGVDWDYLADCNNPKKSKAVGMFYVNNRIPKMLKYYNIWDNKQTRLACYNWGIGKVNKFVGENHTLRVADLPEEPRNLIYKYRVLELSK